MTLEENRIQILYKLMNELKHKNRIDEVAALRWAIFTVERTYNITVK